MIPSSRLEMIALRLPTALRADRLVHRPRHSSRVSPTWPAVRMPLTRAETVALPVPDHLEIYVDDRNKPSAEFAV